VIRARRQRKERRKKKKEWKEEGRVVCDIRREKRRRYFI
jgi:hypothetical protein